jgi:urate oxidase
MIELGENRYGKRAIRLVKVVRDPDGHQVRDLTVDVALEGDFAGAHTAGDNASVVATDTMKNTVYALAADRLTGALEAFGIILATHFLGFPQVRRAMVDLREHRWTPIAIGGAPAPDAFRRAGDATRTATVAATVDSATVESGVADLVLMKTAKSAFSGFPRDRFTTLADVADRVMATRVTATWRHAGPTADWDASHDAISTTLLAAFAEHESDSVQHSIWVMASAMLERHAEIDEVRMSLPNLHHWPVDLVPLGGTNRGEIFVATAEPHGLIEATVRRSPS